MSVSRDYDIGTGRLLPPPAYRTPLPTRQLPGSAPYVPGVKAMDPAWLHAYMNQRAARESPGQRPSEATWASWAVDAGLSQTLAPALARQWYQYANDPNRRDDTGPLAFARVFQYTQSQMGLPSRPAPIPPPATVPTPSVASAGTHYVPPKPFVPTPPAQTPAMPGPLGANWNNPAKLHAYIIARWAATPSLGGQRPAEVMWAQWAVDAGVPVEFARKLARAWYAHAYNPFRQPGKGPGEETGPEAFAGIFFATARDAFTPDISTPKTPPPPTTPTGPTTAPPLYEDVPNKGPRSTIEEARAKGLDVVSAFWAVFGRAPRLMPQRNDPEFMEFMGRYNALPRPLPTRTEFQQKSGEYEQSAAYRAITGPSGGLPSYGKPDLSRQIPGFNEAQQFRNVNPSLLEWNKYLDPTNPINQSSAGYRDYAGGAKPLFGTPGPGRVDWRSYSTDKDLRDQYLAYVSATYNMTPEAYDEAVRRNLPTPGRTRGSTGVFGRPY